MEAVEASVVWDGPRRDVLMLFVEPLTDLWQVDPACTPGEFNFLRELDENEEETGRIAGVEIVGFLTFRWWDDVPELPFLWHVPGYEPMPLRDVLQQLQIDLRARDLATTN